MKMLTIKKANGSVYNSNVPDQQYESFVKSIHIAGGTIQNVVDLCTDIEYEPKKHTGIAKADYGVYSVDEDVPGNPCSSHLSSDSEYNDFMLGINLMKVQSKVNKKINNDEIINQDERLLEENLIKNRFFTKTDIYNWGSK